MSKEKFDKIKNMDEFRDYCICLLQKNGFKISSIREGTGSDGGRDIEAISFEYDTALKEKVMTTWWIELKFRSSNNLGIQDLNDLKTKITCASVNSIDKFLLITNQKLSKSLLDNLIVTSNNENVKLRIWDKDIIKNQIDIKNNSSFLDSSSLLMIDREEETLKLINLLNTQVINVLLCYGPRGNGKSYLARFIANYMYETEQFCYGIIDCNFYNEIGAQIKSLSNFFKLQNRISDFTESVSIQKSETERMDMLCQHIKSYPTIVILDNFENVIEKNGRIRSKQLKQLLNFYSSCNLMKSILILTSRNDYIKESFVESYTFKKIKICGWDLDFILKHQITRFSNINNQFIEKSYSLDKQKETLEILEGNPYAYNIFNQLCANNDIEKIVTSLNGISNIPQFLINQFSYELSKEEQLAMEKFAQFSRPLNHNEFLWFICSEKTLNTLIFKGLIEQSFSNPKIYTMHPMTSHEFNLDNNLSKRKQITNLLIKKMIKKINLNNIDESYSHDLARQVLNMYVNTGEYKYAQEILVKIGTRILSTGDIIYLKSVLNELEESDLTEKYKNRLRKIKAHLESYTDDLEAAKNTYQSMLEVAIKYDDDWAKAAALNGLGSMYRYIYDTDNALKKYQESLDIRLKNDMLLEVSNSYHNIGATYIIMHDYDKAIDSLLKAKTIREKNNDIFRLSATMLYLGECYLLKEDFSKAEEVLVDCYNNKKKINDKVGLIWSIIALAKLYILSENIIGLDYIYEQLIQSKDQAESLKLNRHLVLIRMYLGIYYYIHNKVYLALECYNKGFLVCENLRKELYREDIKTLNLLAITHERPTKESWDNIKSIVKHHKI